MEKSPQFLRDFSKEKNPEARQKAAQEIKAIRKQSFEKSAGAQAQYNELLSTKESQEQQAQQRANELKELAAQIDSLSDSLVGKISNYLKIRALRAATTARKEDLDRLTDAQRKTLEAIKDLPLPGPDETPEHQQARAALEKFYTRQQKIWDTTPYSKEDIARYFNEECLSSLNLADYEKLLRRFPDGFLTHVTRQGIRDHNSMLEHSAGVGEFHKGFEDIAKDGRLRSYVGHFVRGEITEEAIDALVENLQRKYSETGQDPSVESLFYFYKRIERDYLDVSAVHFAADQVANAYYGAETTNEIFFIFPKMLVASQFNSHPLRGTHDVHHNDIYVWSKDDQGLAINAGVVFIPKETMVDIHTGSRYATDSEKKPLINHELVQKMTNLVRNSDFIAFANNAREVVGGLNEYNKRENREVAKLEESLQNNFGITDQKEIGMVLNYDFLTETSRQAADMPFTETQIHSHLTKHRMLYKLSRTTVAAEEYWEKYFANHPERRPSKVVYYKGGDPTRAMFHWYNTVLFDRADDKMSYSARVKELENHFGFVENQRPPANSEQKASRFASLLQASIERRFGVDLEIAKEEAQGIRRIAA